MLTTALFENYNEGLIFLTTIIFNTYRYYFPFCIQLTPYFVSELILILWTENIKHLYQRW